MSVIDPNFRIYLYRLEKTAANPLTDKIRKAMGYGVKKTLRAGWKPALFAAGVGLPLLVGAKLIQSKPTPTPKEVARSQRRQALHYGAGVYRPPQWPSTTSHFRR